MPQKLKLWDHSNYFVNIARLANVKVVHSHFGPVGWSDISSVQRIPAGHVVTFYGYDMSRLPVSEPVWRDRYVKLFSAVDRVLCEGPFMGDALTRLGCPAEKVRVHHLGIEAEKIAFVPRRWVAGTPLRILMAATFTEKKGIPNGLAALGRVADEASIEVTIIGGARPHEVKDQLELRRIQSMVETGNLNVRFMGYQSHARLYEEAYRHHIFLSPSVTAADGDSEGGAPVTMIEMAATGMPIVSTYHCDIPNVINSGVSGLLARERDVEQLAAHIRFLIRNPSEWSGMVGHAKQRIDREFNVRIQGERLASIYEDVAELNRKRSES